MKYGLIFFLAIFLFASCASPEPKYIKPIEKGVFISGNFQAPVFSESEIKKFQSIQDPAERWRAHNIRNYNYEVFIVCYSDLAGFYTVSVRNDTIQKVLKTGIIEELPAPEEINSKYLEYFHTLGGYYKWITTQMYRNTVEIQPDSLYGYPKSIDLNDRDALFDGYLRYRILSVEILE